MDRLARTCPRKRLLALVVAFLPVPALALPASANAAACAATPSEGRNDSYIPGAPVRASIGKGHVLTGVVRSTRGCRPIRGAKLELFQGGPDGRYSTPRGKSWPYRATVVTRRDGTFSFRGPYPFGGGGVTPHIHLHVSAPGHAPIDTTYVPRQGEQRGRLVLVLARA
jgi:protocatechuate 3,4-dioxygenase beta subunit